MSVFEDSIWVKTNRLKLWSRRGEVLRLICESCQPLKEFLLTQKWHDIKFIELQVIVRPKAERWLQKQQLRPIVICCCNTHLRQSFCFYKAKQHNWGVDILALMQFSHCASDLCVSLNVWHFLRANTCIYFLFI